MIVYNHKCSSILSTVIIECWIINNLAIWLLLLNVGFNIQYSSNQSFYVIAWEVTISNRYIWQERSNE
jgi:hypothetical protein